MKKYKLTRSVFFNKSVTALLLLGELEPYAYHTRLKIDQQKQSSYTFIKKKLRELCFKLCFVYLYTFRKRNPKCPKNAIQKNALYIYEIQWNLAFKPLPPGQKILLVVQDHAAVMAIKHVCFNVNKVQISLTQTLIFDLIEKVIYVFYRYNGSIGLKLSIEP
jgi:hypothetical protein